LSNWPSVPEGTAFVATAALVLLTLAGSRGRSAPAAAATVAGALAVTASAAARSVPGPDYPPLVPAWLLAELGVLALAGCVLVRRGRAAAMTRRLAGLAGELSTAGDAGELTAVLREATGDPDLELHWWSDELGGWVDRAGPPAEVQVPNTPVTRGDRQVAGVSHSDRLDADSLRAALGPAVRLSLENAALRASRLAELAALRACRLRIVEQSDRERRSLERNLHDGAQQRVVTLALALRLAARCAEERARDQSTLERLRCAQQLVEQLLTSLREIARGVHPGVLDEGGLVAAVMEHTDGLRELRVSVRSDSGEARFSRSLELTAFLAVAEALDDAQRRGAAVAEVIISGSEEGLRVTVQDDADADAAPGTLTDVLRERLAAFAEGLDVAIVSTGGRTQPDPDGRGALCEW
jgi:signal transduction histidine kinase